ncbi:MAG: Gfo/Idh/MocA family oxidoreductase [Pseudodesulfovibrio sp.]|nr:Gfo/Idh/MocA family oxidoreductase [Pseudodesulfovibrio sp.]
MKKKNIAIVGSGYWGKNLTRNFHALGVLKTVCDKNDALLELFKKQYPDLKIQPAFTEVLTDPEIQGVVIATPAETHFRLAREALLSGKHVYVEKPLCLNDSDARELILLARKQDRLLMVGHLLQYHPIFVRLKELVASGDLGRINYIYSNRLNLGKIRREENALWSFAPHDISMILSLADEEPEKVMATGGSYLHKTIADVTTTHLEFSSGLKAHIFVSWLHPFKEQKLVVVGDKKMAVFDDTLSWKDKLLIYPHKIHWENNIPVPDKAEAERIEVPENEPLRLECQQFLHCIESGQPPYTDGSEGLRVLRVLNAAQRSLDQGGTKTHLDEQKEADIAQTASIHPSAYTDPGATVGPGTSVWHFSHILPGSHVGKNCKIGQNVVIGPDAMIGDGCKIQNNVSVFKGVTLEKNVFCGPSMVFTNVYNPRCEYPRMDKIKKTLIREGASLGANCTIVCGLTIGRYAFVGAGAVVTRDVPTHALVMGNPARIQGWVCACGEKLNHDLSCPVCAKTYQKEGAGLQALA